MWRRRWPGGAVAVLLALGFWCAPPVEAHAAAPGYEIWLGVLAHDAPIFGKRKERGPDLNAELVFPSPVPANVVAGVAPAFRWLLTPRPDIGGDWNTAGGTSQIYLGLTWTAELADNVWRAGDSIFLDVSVGPGLNNGEISTSDPDRLSLGSHLLIHSSLQVGYRIDHAMSVALFLDHASDAGITDPNDGLTNVGVRFGLGF